MRSYQHGSTGSHQNSEVKRAWARVVLGWVTSWEVLVLHPSFLRHLTTVLLSSARYVFTAPRARILLILKRSCKRQSGPRIVKWSDLQYKYTEGQVKGKTTCTTCRMRSYQH